MFLDPRLLAIAPGVDEGRAQAVDLRGFRKTSRGIRGRLG
jgi:hypothetical protein